MKEEEINTIKEMYKPYIQQLLNNNEKYIFNREKIKFDLFWDDDISNFASCSRKTNLININLNSIFASFYRNEMLNIEYFLMHEVRHAYQHEIIKAYKNNENVYLDKEIIEKRIYEENNYKTAIDENGNENEKYFFQDCEMDAYAYSFAIIRYKYKNVPNYIYVPQVYGDEFYKIVDERERSFKEEN